MKYSTITFGIFIALGLGGCSSTHTSSFEKSNNKITKQFAVDFDARLNQIKPKKEGFGELNHSNAYQDVNNYTLINKDERQLPTVFNEKAIINTHDEYLSANAFAAKLLNGYGISLDVSAISEDANEEKQNQNNVDNTTSNNNGVSADSAGTYDVIDLISPNKKVNNQDGFKLKPFKYSGTVKGLLDYVTALNGITWNYNGDFNKSYFVKYETKKFFIYDFSNDTEETNTISNTSKQEAKTTSGGSSKQLTSKNKIKAWDDIKSSLTELKSANGKMSFNRKTGMIVVTDNAYVLSKVSDIIKQLNSSSTKNITVQYKMIRLTYRDDHVNNLSVNFLNDALKNNLFGGFSLNAGMGALSPNIKGGLSTLQTMTNGNFLTMSNKSFSGLIGFLNTLGTTEIAYKTNVNILNNNTYTRQGGKNKEYISSIERTSTFGNNGQDNISTKRDTAIDGVNLSFTPRIVGDQVSLKYSISISDFNGLDDAGLGAGFEGIKLKRDSSLNLDNIALLQNGIPHIIEITQESKKENNSSGTGDHSFWFLGGNEESNKSKSLLIMTVSAYYNN